MNENKSKNLLFLLLLVALVIIAIMGSYIFNLNNTIDDLTPPESALSKEEAETKAKTILETFVNLADYTTTDFSPMPNLLAELGLETRDNISSSFLLRSASLYFAISIVGMIAWWSVTFFELRTILIFGL